MNTLSESDYEAIQIRAFSRFADAHGYEFDPVKWRMYETCPLILAHNNDSDVCCPACAGFGKVLHSVHHISTSEEFKRYITEESKLMPESIIEAALMIAPAHTLSYRQLYAQDLAADLLSRESVTDYSSARAVVNSWSFRKLYAWLKQRGYRYNTLYGRWVRH